MQQGLTQQSHTAARRRTGACAPTASCRLRNSAGGRRGSSQLFKVQVLSKTSEALDDAGHEFPVRGSGADYAGGAEQAGVAVQKVCLSSHLLNCQPFL